MNKLNRQKEPDLLQMNKVQLTNQYLVSKSHVWRKEYIVNPLFTSSYKKCAYCGKKLNYNIDAFEELEEDNQFNLIISEDSYLHIDHFVARKINPGKVVDWENLIPCCPTCNYKKNAHDVIKYPIMNPYEDDPKDLFILYRNALLIKNNSNKANKTISVFDFIKRLLIILHNLDLAIQSTIGIIYDNLQSSLLAKLQGDNSFFNKSYSDFNELLRQAQPEEEYASFKATIILNHPYYQQIKAELINHNCWNFVDLEKKLETIKFDIQ